LASLYNAGFFVPDEYGRVERLKVQQAIRDGLNADLKTAWFFGITTAGFKDADVDEQFFTMAPLADAIRMRDEGATEEPPGEDRYLNIFRMVENPAIMHQVAAAARGGPIDPACPTFPCEKRFDEFFGKFANSEGRIYAKELGDIAGNIFKNGYHGVAAKTSLLTITQGLTGREFLALCGFLDAFGRKDEEGRLYVHVDDFRHIVMHGEFPKGWSKPEHEWGADTVLKTMDIWRLQKVPGFSFQFNTLLLLQELAGKASAAALRLFGFGGTKSEKVDANHVDHDSDQTLEPEARTAATA
jgi:hypothetical protein